MGKWHVKRVNVILILWLNTCFMRITLRIVECHGHSFTPWRKLYFLISIIRGFHFPVTRHSVLEPTTLLEMGLGGGQVVFHSTPTIRLLIPRSPQFYSVNYLIRTKINQKRPERVHEKQLDQSCLNRSFWRFATDKRSLLHCLGSIRSCQSRKILETLANQVHRKPN